MARMSRHWIEVTFFSSQDFLLIAYAVVRSPPHDLFPYRVYTNSTWLIHHNIRLRSTNLDYLSFLSRVILQYSIHPSTFSWNIHYPLHMLSRCTKRDPFESQPRYPGYFVLYYGCRISLAGPLAGEYSLLDSVSRSSVSYLPIDQTSQTSWSEPRFNRSCSANFMTWINDCGA